MPNINFEVEIHEGGRLSLATRSNAGALVYIDEKDEVINTGFGGRICFLDVPTVFRINNYHFSDDYTVSCTNGTVSVVNDLITYTPAALGEGGFYLNHSYIAVTVEEPTPYQPAMVYPADYQTGIPQETTLVASDYATPIPGMTHTETQWQVATDENFTQLVIDVTTAASLTELVVTGLDPDVWYFVRVRYIGELIV